MTSQGPVGSIGGFEDLVGGSALKSRWDVGRCGCDRSFVVNAGTFGLGTEVVLGLRLLEDLEWHLWICVGTRVCFRRRVGPPGRV